MAKTTVGAQCGSARLVTQREPAPAPCDRMATKTAAARAACVRSPSRSPQILLQRLRAARGVAPRCGVREEAARSFPVETGAD